MTKDKKYWQKRSEDRLTDKLEHAERLNKRLDKHYKAALTQIAKDINVLYKQFASENGLDMATANQLITGEEYQVWRMSMQEYLARIDIAPEKLRQALELELNTLTMRSRITRLEAIQAEIKANMVLLAQDNERAAGELLEESLSNTYYESMYDHYKDDNPKVLDLMASHDVRLSRAKIEEVLMQPWSGKNYSQAIWDNAFNLSHRLESMVAQNIMAGTSIDRLTKEMAQAMGKDKAYNIRRLLHTEIGYVKNQGDKLTYEKLEVERYEVLETLDKATCKQCGNIDGKVFYVKDAVPGKNFPPLHPFCRGTTVPYNPDRKTKTRMARDASGKSVKVPRDMSYKKWREWVGLEVNNGAQQQN